jgi:hypothetical protein
VAQAVSSAISVPGSHFQRCGKDTGVCQRSFL